MPIIYSERTHCSAIHQSQQFIFSPTLTKHIYRIILLALLVLGRIEASYNNSEVKKIKDSYATEVIHRPIMLAAEPRQIRGERGGEVANRPGDDNVIVDACVRTDDDHRVADA